MGNTTKSLAAVLFMGVLGAASDASAINNIAMRTSSTDGSGYCAPATSRAASDCEQRLLRAVLRE